MKQSIIFILCLSPLLVHSQIYDPEIFKHYVIPITATLNDTNEVLYDSLKNYNLIMIGENHGVKEYVQFMAGLIRDFTTHHKKVIAGFEVERGIMHDSLKNLTYPQVANSDFFTKDIDGRQNSTLATIIAALSKDSNVSLTFFDIRTNPINRKLLKDTSKTYYINYVGYYRDSMMYETLNSAIKKDTNAVTISICGDYHSMIERKGAMAYFLKNDSASAIKNKRILTIRDVSESGTMLNNEGKGLQLNPVYDEGKAIQLRTVDQNLFFLDGFVNYDNYLLLTPYSLYDGYCGILFIRHVTAAMPCKN